MLTPSFFMVRMASTICSTIFGDSPSEGSPEEVRGNPQVRAIYLGEGLVYDARHREGAGA